MEDDRLVSYLESLPTGTTSFKVEIQMPIWSIIYFLERLSLNHMKLVTIQRLCQLTANGIPSSAFSVVETSARLFPSKSFSDTKFNNTIAYAEKSQNPR